MCSKNNLVKQVLKGLLFVLMAGSLVFAPAPALAQGRTQQQRPADKAGTFVESPQESIKSRPEARRARQNNGIKLHGHWVIEVHNPNGSLASHTEFENSLITSGNFPGSALLAEFFARIAMPGLWEISLEGPPGAKTCGVADCIIGESSDVNGAVVSKNLAVTFGNGITLLSGTLTFTQSASIVAVGTNVGLCGYPQAGTPAPNPQSCTTRVPLTDHQLSQPVSVSVGQVVNVSVSFTFS